MSENRIICSAEYDSPAFASGGEKRLVVTLNFEVRDIGGAPTDGEQDDAKKKFKEFLAAIPKARFFVYRLPVEPDPGAPAPAQELTRDKSIGTDGELTRVGSASGDLIQRIHDWLQVRAKKAWITTFDKPTGELDYRALIASQLILSAHSWDAPLPQDAGLVSTVIFPDTGDPLLGQPVIVPYFGADQPVDDPIPLIAPASRDHPPTFNYDPMGDFGHVTGEAHAVRAPDPDDTSLVELATVFVKVNPQGEDLHRTLKRLADRAGSMLWTFPHVVGIEWDNEPERVDPTLDQLKRAVWRGMKGVATLLDPLVVGLTMADVVREGPFVSALNVLLDRQIPGVDTNGLADAITSTVKTEVHFPDSDKARRQKLAELIVAVFDLGALPPGDKLDDSTSLLPVTLRIYAEQAAASIDKIVFDRTSARARFANSFDAQIGVELGALGHKFQTEEGIETALIKLLAGLGIDSKFIVKALKLDPSLESKCAAAIEDFRRLLADSFNGADATRFAQGTAYSSRLIAEAKTKGKNWLLTDLKDALKDTQWLVRRLGLTTVANNSAFNALLAYLPCPADDFFAPPVGLDPTPKLAKTFETIRAELLADAEVARFVPDSYPRPLPLQIAVDQDTADGDNFAEIYNGIALLLRRTEVDSAKPSRWAHANLATLDVFKKDSVVSSHTYEPLNAVVTLHPMLPVAIDRQRTLFVEYDGEPLSSNAFGETSAPGNEPEADQPPFYHYDDPTPAQLKAKMPLPPLGYGLEYSVAGHAVGKGGALPEAVQDPSAPWLPADDPVVPGDIDRKKDFIQTRTYLRTTAVGRVVINEKASGSAPRIGAGIEGVQPLFRDFPRVGFSVRKEGSTVGSAIQDVFRNADGSGAFSLPEDGASAALVLSDLWWWTGAGELTVSIFHAANVLPRATGQPEWTFPIKGRFAHQSLRIEITGTGTGDKPDQRTLSFSARISGDAAGAPSPKEPQDAGADLLKARSIWVRIKIKATDAAKGVAIGFADPSAEMRSDHAASRPGADNLVLIAPKAAGPSEWVAPYENAVLADIVFPRVGFIDFDRWLNNPARHADAWGTTKLDDFKAFRSWLMTAYVGRHIDDRLSPLVDSLPDLAVDKLLIELTPLDDLSQLPFTANARQPSARVISLAKLVDRPLPSGHDPADEKKNRLNLANDLAKLAHHHSASLRIVSEGEVLEVRDPVPGGKQEYAITVNVPRGVVARLTVRPMVPAPLVGSVFDSRIANLATELRDGHYVFDGAALTVESMLGAIAKVILTDKDGKPTTKAEPWQGEIVDGRCALWERLAADAVRARPAGLQRSYDLVSMPPTEPEPAWHWRKLSSIDIQTQRWRFTGRPIYSWFDPKRGSAVGTAGSVAVVPPMSDELLAFEAESFFDRDAQDADTQTMRLDPAPATTVLQSFPWEPPSATYFRHRLSVKGRYAGALRSNQVSTVRAWGDDGKTSSAKGWMRVAMLADRTRLQLTRPQLRALMPLTTVPSAEEAALSPTPPVMAVLDERPYAHGGLADRIGAEIKTSLGYVLPSNGTLDLGDTRKEFGPDPRLNYSSTPADEALTLTLRAEGPVGLTFDTDSVRAPTFANTTLVLQPALLNGASVAPASLEEHFLSVALRRYLDHRWLTDDPTSDIGLPIDRPWWIELPRPQAEEKLSCSPAGTTLCKIATSDSKWTVEINTHAVDPYQPETPEALVAIATISTKQAVGLAFLHLPLEAGRASLSVFALPDTSASAKAGANVGAGLSNLPLLMASVEWVVPAGSTSLSVPETASSYPTSASPPTLMNWTRTGKNFDLLHSSKADHNPLEPHTASDVVVNRTAGAFKSRKSGAALSFEPATGRYPNPLYVHRHHAVISTRLAKGEGRSVEVFEGAFRTFGKAPTLTADTTTLRLVEFETPAAPLAYNAPKELGMFKSAYFDLYSVLGSRLEGQSKVPKGLSFFLRPLVGSATDVLNQMVLLLTIHRRVGDPLEAKLTITPKAPAKIPAAHLRGVLIEVRTDRTADAEAIFAGGEVLDLDIAVKKNDSVAFEVAELKAIELAFDSIAVSGEFWSDVSLLTLPRPTESQPAPKRRDFSFDWFFTGASIAPAEAVTPAELTKMVEAEARIIAVSPPILVED